MYGVLMRIAWVAGFFLLAFLFKRPIRRLVFGWGWAPLLGYAMYLQNNERWDAQLLHVPQVWAVSIWTEINAENPDPQLFFEQISKDALTLAFLAVAWAVSAAVLSVVFFFLRKMFAAGKARISAGQERRAEREKIEAGRKKAAAGRELIIAELAHLPDGYKIFQSVLAPGAGGRVAEIQCLVVSRFGVFVLGEKHWRRGVVRGEENEPFWTRFFDAEKGEEGDGGEGGKDAERRTVKNPLLQNAEDIEDLAHSGIAPADKIHSVMCFTGPAEIKMEQQPAYVKTHGWVNYILGFTDPVFSEEEADAIAEKIAALQKDPTLKKRRQEWLKQQEA